jgi:PKD repeat protein
MSTPSPTPTPAPAPTPAADGTAASFSYVINGLQVVFTDTSSPASGLSLQAWSWNFGDGIGTSTTESPTYNFTQAGTYNVELTVTDSSSQMATYYAQITLSATEPTPTEDINALVARQTNAVQSLESSAALFAQFINNAADAPITIGGLQVPSLQGLIAQAQESATQRQYEIVWSQDDLTPYIDSTIRLFRSITTVDVNFPANLVGSYFTVATPPSSNMTLSFAMGASTVVVTIPAGETTGSVTSGASSEISVPLGTAIIGTLTSDDYGATGLALAILGTTS